MWPHHEVVQDLKEGVVEVGRRLGRPRLPEQRRRGVEVARKVPRKGPAGGGGGDLGSPRHPPRSRFSERPRRVLSELKLLVGAKNGSEGGSHVAGVETEPGIT